MTGRILLLVIALALLSAIPASAQSQLGPSTTGAQTSPEGAPSPNDVQELSRILSDPRIVDWLKQQAGQQPPQHTQDAAHSLRSDIEARISAARQRISELANAWSNFPLIPDVLAEAWNAELRPGDGLRSLIYVIIFLFVGGGLEWLFWQYFHPLLVRIESLRPPSLWRRTANSLVRLLMQSCALAVFAAGSVGMFLIFSWPAFLERLVVNLLIAVVGLRALAMLSRFVLSPHVPQLRLVPLSDTFARAVHGWHIAVASILMIAMATTDTLGNLAQGSAAPDAVNAALAVSVAFGAITVVALLTMVWSLSTALVKQRPTQPRGGKKRLDPVALKLLPVGLSIVILTAFILWVFNATELMWTVLVLGLFLPAATLTRAIVDFVLDEAARGDQVADPARAQQPEIPLAADTSENPNETSVPAAPPIDVEPAAEQVGSDRDDRFAIYRPVVRRASRFLLAVFALFVLLAAWGSSIDAMSQSPSFLGRLVKMAIDIVAVLLVADLVWIWARTAIDLRMANYVAPPPGEPPGPEARMATLLPLLRNILLVGMVALVALTVLSSLGINVAPLLAGAGIVGVAIGFGAQSLVRDIVSGIFYLIDDAFRVGEYIEIGNLRGTVESMSLRSMRVRHHRGAVHTIPFGELKSLTNYSRDWVIMKLEFRVPFDTDLKLVKKLVKQVGAELQADPNYGSSILEPLKSQGVRRMEEFNMVVGVKFMAKPGAQWVIRRDAYQKLRDAFEKSGINFAQRNVKVEVLADRPLSEAEQRAVTGAAQTAVEERAQQPAPVPDEP